MNLARARLIVKKWLLLAMVIGIYTDIAICARITSSKVRDEESSRSRSPEGRNRDRPPLARQVSVPSHVAHRLNRFVRYVGIIQRIARETNVARADVIRSGASQYQDRSSRQPGYQASHLVRGRNINRRIQTNYPDQFDELRNFAGHTQIAPTFANAWHSVGGDMDRTQTNYFDDLNTIDFSQPLNDQSRALLSNFKNSFMQILDRHINAGRLAPENIQQLRDARERIENISVEDLYARGQDGYNGVHSEEYRGRRP